MSTQEAVRQHRSSSKERLSSITMSPKLGIWRLMTNHQPHEHTLRRPQQHHDDDHARSSSGVAAEVRKPRPTKYERPKEEEDHHHPASSEEFTLGEAQEEEVEHVVVVEVTEEATAVEATSTTTTIKKKKSKHVSFDIVQVRTYEIILGDNPDCSFPLSLGWRYTSHPTQDLDQYELQQLPQRKKPQEEIENNVHVGQLLGLIAPTHIADHQTIATGTSCMRPLTLYERRMILRAQGHSEQQLRQAERQRRVELCLQWAGGQCPKQSAFPYSQRFFLNYVL